MSFKIKSALISVSDKTGLDKLALYLQKSGVKIISTGGTAKYLRDLKIAVTDVSDYTGFPEIMDGRVKTLHPKIHGGLLGLRDDKKHLAQAAAQGIEGIDMVVVNLYPFAETVKKGASPEECIENIDIGGPSMIRSAAKNHKFVAVVTDTADYETVIAEMEAEKGRVTEALARKLAAKAFALTAAYDSAISTWFSRDKGEDFPAIVNFVATRAEILRYGENPHQKAALYRSGGRGIASANQIQGKELSYNNICDADAALELVAEFKEPTAVIVKHANPCGVASAASLAEAYEKAESADPVSAYGSIIALNKEIDAATAEKMSHIFVEVIIGPAISEEAKAILARKKNLRLLITGELPTATRKEMQIKNISGGFLLQERDAENVKERELKIVTDRVPTKAEMKDMMFAFAISKHVKSNAIVLAKNMMTVGIGAGQMSRVDSVRIASWKGTDKEGNNKALGAVMASDAFLPFADGLILAAEAGVKAVIQPGGSIRDEEVIKAANEREIAMVFTGRRHFRH